MGHFISKTDFENYSPQQKNHLTALLGITLLEGIFVIVHAIVFLIVLLHAFELVLIRPIGKILSLFGIPLLYISAYCFILSTTIIVVMGLRKIIKKNLGVVQMKILNIHIVFELYLLSFGAFYAVQFKSFWVWKVLVQLFSG
jgi:hypothetical protein